MPDQTAHSSKQRPVTPVRVPRKNATSTRGRPFPKGNAGRPRGARNRATIAVETLLDGEAERLARKAVEMALGGDTTALRLCLDRIAPPRKGRFIKIDLPVVRTADDVVTAMGAVLDAVGNGRLTPDEGQALTGLVEARRRAIETVDIERRLAAIEQHHRGRNADKT